MQGRIVCRDLLESGYSLFMADLHPERSGELANKYPNTAVSEIDLRDYNQILAIIYAAEPDVVINCAEGNWNLAVYKACLECNVSCIDLGSDIPATKEQLGLHPQFQRANLTAITGCGSTPGINNVMLYYAVTNGLETVETIEAGFAWDSNIKKFVVPFSIESIIEEFTEPAPAIMNSRWINYTPREHTEVRDFRAVGQKTMFPVRHPETYTFFRYYKNRGLQNVRFYAGFPDHARTVIEHYIDAGLGSKEPQEIAGISLRPIDFLSNMLRNLSLPDGYTETENLWVAVEGTKNGKRQHILLECIVPTLPGWEEAGCNIDTGFPASIIAQMIKNGTITARGSFAPGTCCSLRPLLPRTRKKAHVNTQKRRTSHQRLYSHGCGIANSIKAAPVSARLRMNNSI